MRTAQELYDTIATHLLMQNARSEDPDTAVVSSDPYESDIPPACLYRGPNGLRCAVGCVIPDEEYNRGLEGCGIADLLRLKRFSFELRHEFKRHLTLLNDLQNMHDVADIERWPERLQHIALRHNLKPIDPAKIRTGAGKETR